MFIETHSDRNKILTFIKSAHVQAFPCGRRRGNLREGSGATANEQYYFPFDPEARLNTEANNRKASGLNGFTQTYLKDWDKTNKLLTLALAGYFFDITLSDDYIGTDDVTGEYLFKTNDFGNTIHTSIKQKAESLKAAADEAGITEDIEAATNVLTAAYNATKIYANILIEDAQLFSGFQEYYASVLRNQSSDSADSLDLLKTTASTGDIIASRDFNNFYFSGLSFSTTPLTDKTTTRSSAVIKGPVKQTLVSLCILTKTKDQTEATPTWKIYQPALLPRVEHGEADDTVVVGDLSANSLTTPKASVTNLLDVQAAGDITLTADAQSEHTGCVNAVKFIQSGSPVPTINLRKDGDSWQLQISRVTINQ
jgi:hypothetical protein